MKDFILKGDIVFATSNREIKTFKNGYLVCVNNLVKGVFSSLPNEYKSLDILDYSNKLIVPGFYDLHVHASQYQYRGTGMDEELLAWLNKYAFDEEKKFNDINYAKKAYKMFVDELKRGFTTRANIFATSSKEATLELMRQLEESGLISNVGLVEMDRGSPKEIQQESVSKALKDTEEYILESQKFTNTNAIITPRFLPSCSGELMKGLSLLRKKYNLPLQSHLDENLDEISLVLKLENDIKNYSEGYLKYDLFGGDCHTVMAHCVYNNEDEISLLKERGVYVAHCPESNLNLASGIAPISKYLDNGIKVGLGSDVAAGSSLSLLRAARQSIQVSKLYYRYIDHDARKLDCLDAFYMLTLGGGSFFGDVGSFIEGYEFDALVIDDSLPPSLREFSMNERIERLFYIGDEQLIKAKFVRGKQII